VIIDEPQRINYGGYTAAPAFANIARRMTLLDKTRDNQVAEGQPGSIDRETHKSGVSHPTDTTVSIGRNAENLARYRNVVNWLYSESESDTGVLDRRPEKCRDDIASDLVPDLRGMTARDAISLLRPAVREIVVRGNGMIESQNPLAGSGLHDAQSITLKCRTNVGGDN